MIYNILECRFDDFVKKAKYIQNKCQKNGNDFKFTVVKDRVYLDIKGQSVDPKKAGFGTFKPYVVVDVEGVAKINDWEVVGVNNPTDAGNIIFKINNKIEIPSKYYDMPITFCEHCHTNRYRSKAFILHNTKTNDFKQVGSSCVKEFTGGLDITSVASAMRFMLSIDDEYGYSYGGYVPVTYTPISIGVIAVEIIKAFGYVKKGEEFNTYNKVLDYYTAKYGSHFKMSEEEKKKLKLFMNNLRSKGVDEETNFDADAEIINKTKEWVDNSNMDNGYMLNARTVMNLETISPKFLALYISVIASYMKYATKIELNERTKSDSNYLGNVGDKVVTGKIIDARVLKEIEPFTMYGPMSYMQKFIDDKGNNIIWVSSNYVIKDVIGHSVKGTIKKIQEYNGTKQTILTRCKIVD